MNEPRCIKLYANARPMRDLKIQSCETDPVEASKRIRIAVENCARHRHRANPSAFAVAIRVIGLLILSVMFASANTNIVSFTAMQKTNSPFPGFNRFIFTITNCVPGSNYQMQQTRDLTVPFGLEHIFTATNQIHVEMVDIDQTNAFVQRFFRIKNQ